MVTCVHTVHTFLTLPYVNVCRSALKMDQNAYVIQATGNICMVLLEIALQVHNAPKKKGSGFHFALSISGAKHNLHNISN
jgi:hypothetical protein